GVRGGGRPVDLRAVEGWGRTSGRYGCYAGREGGEPLPSHAVVWRGCVLRHVRRRPERVSSTVSRRRTGTVNTTKQRISAGSSRSDAGLRDDPLRLDYLLQRSVVALVLVGVELGERGDRAIERVALPQIGGDRDPVPRACVRPRERPRAHPTVGTHRGRGHPFRRQRTLPVAELADVVVALGA